MGLHSARILKEAQAEVEPALNHEIYTAGLGLGFFLGQEC